MCCTKTLGRCIALLAAALPALAQVGSVAPDIDVYAINPKVSNCYPGGSGSSAGDACSQSRELIFTGSVSVYMTAICTNGQALSAQGGAGAYNCSNPVNILANGVTYYVAAHSPPLRYGSINTNGSAVYYWTGVEYWLMWNDQYCDGYRSTYVQPPAPC